MRSIKSYLIVVMVTLVLGASLLSTFIAYGFARSTALDIIHSDIELLAASVASYIAADIDGEMNVLQSLAVSDTITSAALTLEEKAAYLVRSRDLLAARINYFVIDTEGTGCLPAAKG